MASTYSTGGLEIMADGEKAGSWGDITSNNLQILERMVGVAGTITLSGTTHTLTVSDGSLSDGHYGVLVFSGSPSGTNTVTISPNDSARMFHVLNSSGESVILTQGSGGNVTVTDGASAIVYCDGAGAGAEVVDLSATLTAGDAGLRDIAALAVTDGNVIVGDGSNWVAESGATARTSLGAQAQGDVLDDLNTTGANAADSEFLVGTGAGALAWESGATALTSLGLGTGDTPQFNGIEVAASDTTLTRSGAGVVAVDGNNIYTAGTAIAAADGGTIGQQTIWMPAGAMIPRVTTAAATLNSVEIATSLIALRTMDFDSSSAQFCGFGIQMPKGWDEGTLVAQFVWSATGQSPDNDGVRWFIRAGAYASNDALTTALGTAVGAAAQDHSATDDDVMITAETAAITVAGSPGAEEWVYFEVYRDVSDAGDDLDVNARLHGVKIHYTLSSGTDD